MESYRELILENIDYDILLERNPWDKDLLDGYVELIFEISEANRKAKCLEIKAYDCMMRFEKAFTSLESIGNACDFMELCQRHVMWIWLRTGLRSRRSEARSRSRPERK